MNRSDELLGIIKGCKNGDNDSFSWLVDLYSKRLYGYFYRLSGNRTLSDDLLSELFVKLVKKIGSYKGGSFDGWIFRIASNIFADHLRAKQKQKKLIENKVLILESASVGLKYSDKHSLDKLQRQLDKLDEKTKELIVLRFYSGLSFKEIAQIRKEPIGTTLSKLHRAVAKLRELMVE
jgi:RNA polymerase sigma-70 factor (ECF subfamily)